jgi:hypothetical protein
MATVVSSSSKRLTYPKHLQLYKPSLHQRLHPPIGRAKIQMAHEGAGDGDAEDAGGFGGADAVEGIFEGDGFVAGDAW